jgi:hypothetical protein
MAENNVKAVGCDICSPALANQPVLMLLIAMPLSGQEI